ncbi:8-oxoguanine deaminase [Selenihalanaerobacter shriftii]|uniref:Cytosine/adenosine deaminase n=1 Tax=Selenihalanaerobacter shriftii TaxID=142842 RepID=A0A1T4PLD7_9FIRM|nr:8-oxoguanine deaminase [Selenihalanaerobacter shriftii]SJZ91708.1 Cytosine/adenosine deaminase [Selenihalanaerobacter shriftii]
MTTKLIRNADKIVTMDDKRNIFEDSSILIEDGKIKAIGKEALNEDVEVDEVIDGKDKFIFPGLVNTHHHFYQTLTRCIPEVQNVELFQWLKFLYPIWANLTSEAVYTSSLVALGELLKTGCTTSSDHHYVFPQGVSGELIDRQIEAARKLGARFHPCRGSMSLGEDDGGLPPNSVIQSDEEILEDSQRLIEDYHDPDELSMCQIVLAPCSPFSVTSEIMEETVKLAREYEGVNCHTHLAETEDENDFCQEAMGMRPLEYMESVGWIGDDIWFAHGVHFNEEELDLLAKTSTGVAHCPVSNQKLASGIAKIPSMLERDIKVGLAVDGSASNDSSDMIGEMKSALLLHRVNGGIDAISPEEVLEMATRGGARLLGRDDIGSLEPGKAADLFMVDKYRLGLAGAFHDPITALITCGDSNVVDMTMVNGEIVVKEGKLVNVDERNLAKQANEISKVMVNN